ncbi:MAG TPA: RES family NAD+ phosphorylase [Methylocystis sp.]|nr:RES family NAD+ phosphorylase [Methylocystis sp.]
MSMQLWRISNYDDLQGVGGLLASARWRNAPRAIVYAAESPAGALVEVLVHFDREDLPEDLQLIEISVDDDASTDSAGERRLSHFWRHDLAETRRIGDIWLGEEKSLALRLPSVICPRTWNFLLNSRDPESSRMRVVSAEKFPFDGRLK